MRREMGRENERKRKWDRKREYLMNEGDGKSNWGNADDYEREREREKEIIAEKGRCEETCAWKT